MVTEHIAAAGLSPIGRIPYTFMEVMALAFETRLLRLREQRHRTGPGEYKTPTQHNRGRHTGAVLRQLRVERGVGRPPWIFVPRVKRGNTLTVERAVEIVGIISHHAYESAVKLHGSQRKAAAALGISLGKLQRGLRKAAAALGISLGKLQRGLRKAA